MNRKSLRSPLLVLALGLTLSSAASAAPVPWGGFLGEEGRGFLGLLEGLLSGHGHLKHGCSISPDGQPVCGPKAGCSISPDGRPQCPTPVTPKLGCSVDPNGHTVCTT
jgi:hypothetical protein